MHSNRSLARICEVVSGRFFYHIHRYLNELVIQDAS